MGSLYKTFLKEVSSVAYLGTPAPKLHNLYSLQKSPFPRKINDVFMCQNEMKSKQHSHQQGDRIPVPTVIKRHLLQPVNWMEKEIGLGKIVGFKIEAKGRAGSRSMRRGLSYGMLDGGKISRINGSLLDYYQTAYTTKRGATGVKVWIQYGRK